MGWREIYKEDKKREIPDWVELLLNAKNTDEVKEIMDRIYIHCSEDKSSIIRLFSMALIEKIKDMTKEEKILSIEKMAKVSKSSLR